MRHPQLLESTIGLGILGRCRGFSMRQETSRLPAGKKRAYTISVLLVAAALLAGAYVWVAQTSVPHPAGPLEQVTIANIRYPGTCPVIVAQAKGYFANEGIRVTLLSHSSGKATLDAVFRGRANLGTTGDLPVMFA